MLIVPVLYACWENHCMTSNQTEKTSPSHFIYAVHACKIQVHHTVNLWWDHTLLGLNPTSYFLCIVTRLKYLFFSSFYQHLYILSVAKADSQEFLFNYIQVVMISLLHTKQIVLEDACIIASWLSSGLQSTLDHFLFYAWLFAFSAQCAWKIKVKIVGQCHTLCRTRCNTFNLQSHVIRQPSTC